VRVFGRNFIIFFLIEAEERMQEKPVVFYLFCIYSVSEPIRYPYYMLRIYDLGKEELIQKVFVQDCKSIL
jgi:very-long-chain (3R)-3-hydroxyacyl-CoA dehydratase